MKKKWKIVLSTLTPLVLISASFTSLLTSCSQKTFDNFGFKIDDYVTIQWSNGNTFGYITKIDEKGVTIKRQEGTNSNYYYYYYFPWENIQYIRYERYE